MSRYAWPGGAWTGIGSLPGADPAEAIRLVLGEYERLPFLPELPGRGMGSELIGRTASVLVDLPVELQPGGWTMAGRPGRDLRRARDFLHRDLDLVTELAAGVPVLKVQLAGPLTLAAGLELPTLHKVISDRGATRELAESLAEGAAGLLTELARRLPDTAFVLQLDEPGLPAVLAGAVPTPSGYGTVRSVAQPDATQLLAGVLAVAPVGARVVHCCAADVPYRLVAAAGADAVAVDAGLLAAAHLDAIGEFVDAGRALWLGAVPATGSTLELAPARSSVRELWRKLGFDDTVLAERVVLTPACGQAGATPAYVRRSAKVLQELARAVAEQSL